MKLRERRVTNDNYRRETATQTRQDVFSKHTGIIC